MSSGVYSALSGSVAKMQELEIAVNNLANVGNTGFKASRVSFQSLLSDFVQNNEAGGTNFTTTSGRFVDFSQGDVQKTGRSLDVAINGPGFFKVAGENGFQYTRQGNFKLDQQGNLVTSVGELQVLSAEGPVSLPHRNVEINHLGQVLADGVQIGQLNLYTAESLNDFEEKGNGLWELREGATEMAASGEIVQGCLEQSNVNAMLLTTKVIEIKRAYAAFLKSMKVYSEMGEKSRQIGQIS
jgi:flagellar basal body rod protein FlgG